MRGVTVETGRSNLSYRREQSHHTVPDISHWLPSRPLLALVATVGLMALVAAVIGVISVGDGPATRYVTVHGETVELVGSGIYTYDTVFKAAANRGTDLLTILVGLPLLVAISILYARRVRLGRLLLPGALVYVLYVYASLSLGTAYNDLFLVYVLLVSASLAAFVLAVRDMDIDADVRSAGSRLPRRAPAIFMFISGVVTLMVWLMEPLTALITGDPPKYLDHSTTLTTHTLDMALIVPATLLAGMLILRRDPRGYIIALSLLVLEVLLAPMIAFQSLFQVRAGVSFTPAEIIGPIAGFVSIALVALWVCISIVRGLTDVRQREPD